MNDKPFCGYCGQTEPLPDAEASPYVYPYVHGYERNTEGDNLCHQDCEDEAKREIEDKRQEEWSRLSPTEQWRRIHL